MVASNAQDAKHTIVTVVKLSGIAWFNRMEEGVKQYAADTGQNASQVGPASADAALQVQMIEDLIAKKVDAITVVPNSPEALEPVLAKRLARASRSLATRHQASRTSPTTSKLSTMPLMANTSWKRLPRQWAVKASMRFSSAI